MRKLVTLRKISDIQPIPNADAIEVATVDGWQCVVKKEEFSVGQEVIYFEIDSILPATRPEFAFLMARGCKMLPTEDGDLLEGHRLRTIKLRGQISQGLIIPLLINESFSEDDDLTVLFGVKKYERPTPAQLAGMCRGNYPGWLPKTDQERVQNVRNLPEGPYHYEEKMEGSSMTIYHDGEILGVTSRNVDLLLDQQGNAYVDTAAASGLYDALTHFMAGRENSKVAIRGELIGPGIQGNIYKMPAIKYHIYDVWLDGRYLTNDEREEFIFDHLAPHANPSVVQAAQPLGMINLADMTTSEIVAMATGKSEFGDTLREGLVFKSAMFNKYGQVVSFKAISPEYLLKEAA